MRTLGYGITLGFLFAVTFASSASDMGSFQLATTDNADEVVTRNLGATDIVVTDIDGRVLESWRGELKAGDVVRLGPYRLTPANALPLEWVRLRPDRALSGFYDPRRLGTGVPRRSQFGTTSALTEHNLWPSVGAGAGAELRLVLFLRKEASTGSETVWLPTSWQPGKMHFGFRPPRYNFNNFDLALQACTALVEGGRVLALCGISSRSDEPNLEYIASTLDALRHEVARIPVPRTAAFEK